MSADLLTLSGGPPIVIAHRGASGLRPEHTLAAYALAIEQGADAIEPDLVLTSDGVLVARHDRYLSTTTDVASRPQFADRRRADPSGESDREDWWVEDFTLAEIKALAAVQPFPGRSREHDGHFPVPTFEEVIGLVKSRSAELGRPVAIYPETKSPEYFARIGLEMETPLIAALERAGWVGADAPVYIQSFEPGILRDLDAKLDVPLVQLVTPAVGAPPGTPNIPLEDIAAYADGVGPAKNLLIGSDGEETDFVARAHALGLFVHAWTYRDDAAASYAADVGEELERAYRLGVDGVFSDFPATAVAARAR